MLKQTMWRVYRRTRKDEEYAKYKEALKASLGSKHILFSYFIITEPTELKLSEIASAGNSNAVNFHGRQLGLNVACDLYQ